MDLPETLHDVLNEFHCAYRVKICLERYFFRSYLWSPFIDKTNSFLTVTIFTVFKIKNIADVVIENFILVIRDELFSG